MITMLRPLLVGCLVVAAGCTSLPGRDFPRPAPMAIVHAPNTALTQPFAAAAHAHEEASGFRLYSVGVDGLLLRLELIAQATSSLDLQYYIFHGDESGRLITEALQHAAQRGVRVRILVDDAESVAGDEQLLALAEQPQVEIRVFNPWRYRGHSRLIRGLEFAFSKSRLDYRMHNKLFVADGVIALMGGRNIGDQYFQVDPESQFADDDVFVTGPVVLRLAGTFQQFWDSEFAIPTQALASHRKGAAAKLARRVTSARKASTAGMNYQQKLASGEPLASLLANTAPLSWATAELACDSPDKKRVAEGDRAGSLMFGLVAKEIRATQTELLMVTPYLVPSRGELKLLAESGAPQRRVRILTTSLEATNDPLAEAGYTRHRVQLLQSGVELFELRTHPESTRGSGQSAKMTRHGTYGLHAKLLVFDRSALFVGSMNYDERSRWLNTELGLIIRSPELATQTAQRFQAMTQPASAYSVSLVHADPQASAALLWSTEEQGKPVTYHVEPARNSWQKLEVRVLSILPADREL
ncbi:MAG: phospholipase D-like domain-containing protein [Acetobacteraceae bacterium]